MYHRTKEKWHTMSPDEVERRLKSDAANGLSAKVCRARLERFGENALFLPYPCDVQTSARRILTDVALWILVLLCLVAICFARFATALTILFVLAVSCTVSIVAHVKTNRIKETMSAHSEPRVRVLRAGKAVWCRASDIVPGDVLVLEQGDVLPCDARIVSSSRDFCVLTCHLNESGKPSYTLTPKDASCTYGATDDVPPLKRVNMLYTASVVHQGRAKAVVTETGEGTYAASQYGLHAFAMQVGDPSYLTPMRRYVNRYSLIMCACILPVTLIGLFAGRGRLELLDVMLLALSLVVSSMSEQVLSMGRILCACSVIRASMSKNESNSAVMKNYRAIDALSRVDELFLFGKTAVSDGKLHPYAVYTEDALFVGPKINSAPVKQFYEMLYYYESCATDAAYRHVFAEDLQWENGVSELGDVLSFDRASARIKTVFSKPLEASSAWVEMVVRQNGGQEDRRFRIHRCDEPEPLLQCNARRLGGQTVAMDRQDCQRLFDIYCQLKGQGTQVCAYIREEGGLAVFEGILSCREAYAPDISETLTHLEDSHVRVSLFLPEEGKYYLNYLLGSGWIESGKDAVSASRLRAAGKTLSDVFDKKRVFFGFFEDEIAEQIKLCRKQGKTTASLGLRYGDSPVMTPADVCISCHSGAYMSAQVPFDQDRNDSAGDCDQSVRRNADVLIHRACPEGGGLLGILNAVTTARSIHLRMMLAMQYLLVAQLLRMTVVVLPLLFGATMISAPLLLISGVWVDLAFILAFAFYRCSPHSLKEIPDYRRFFRAPLKSRPDWLCATLVCGLFTVLSGWILAGTNALPAGAGLELYMFLALLLTQGCLLFCLLRTVGDFSGRWTSRLSALLIFACLLALLLPVILIPPVSAWFGGSALNLLMLLLAALSPLYLLGCYFISVTYRPKFAVSLQRLTRPFAQWLRNLSRSRAYNDGEKGTANEKRSGQEDMRR